MSTEAPSRLRRWRRRLIVLALVAAFPFVPLWPIFPMCGGRYLEYSQIESIRGLMSPPFRHTFREWLALYGLHTYELGGVLFARPIDDLNVNAIGNATAKAADNMWDPRDLAMITAEMGLDPPAHVPRGLEEIRGAFEAPDRSDAWVAPDIGNCEYIRRAALAEYY